MYGMIDPARDYSVYDMSWGGLAGSLVSTVDDLNSFYRRLLTGRILGPAELRAMKTTVPTYEAPPGQEAVMRYGLGIYALTLSDGRWYWGHDGAVLGAGTLALSTEDGRRQVAVGLNLMKYQRLDADGRPRPHAIDEAVFRHVEGALLDTPPPAASGRTAAPAPRALPTAADPGRPPRRARRGGEAGGARGARGAATRRRASGVPAGRAGARGAGRTAVPGGPPGAAPPRTSGRPVVDWEGEERSRRCTSFASSTRPATAPPGSGRSTATRWAAGPPGSGATV